METLCTFAVSTIAGTILKEWGKYISESSAVLASFPQAHYTVESLAKELTESFKNYKNKAKIAVETNKPHSVLKTTRRDQEVTKKQ